MDIADAQSMFAGSIYKITKNAQVQKMENPFPLKWTKIHNTINRNGDFENKLFGIYDTPQSLLFAFGVSAWDSSACFLVNKTTGVIDTIDSSSGNMIDNPFPDFTNLPARVPDIFSWDCPVPSQYLDTSMVGVGKTASYFIRRKGLIANPNPNKRRDSPVQTIQKIVQRGDGTFSVSEYIVPGKYRTTNGQEYPESIKNFALDKYDNIAYTSEEVFNPSPQGARRYAYRVRTATGNTLLLEGKFWVMDGHIYALKANKDNVILDNIDERGNIIGSEWSEYSYRDGQIQKYGQNGSPDGPLRNVLNDQITNALGNHNTSLEVLNKFIFSEKLTEWCENDDGDLLESSYYLTLRNEVVIGDEQGNFQFVNLDPVIGQARALKASQNYVYTSGYKRVREKSNRCSIPNNMSYMATHIVKLDPNRSLSLVASYDLHAEGYSEIHTFDVSANDVINFSATKNGQQVLGKIDANGTITNLGINQAGKPVKIVSVQ